MRPSRMILAVLVGVPLLTGATCGGQKTDPPKIVEVPVDRVVAVPAALSKDCYDEAAKEQSVQEAVRLAKLRRESLTECSSRMRRIRDLQRPLR